MKIVNLKLQNFRNYDDLNIDFSDNLNIIIGNNAQGKTNILESIYFLSITKSFLSINDRNCIKKDRLFAKLACTISQNNKMRKLSLFINEKEKQLNINGDEIKKHADYIGNLKVIVFGPDNIRLIKNSPANRRRFLNIEISQLFIDYITILNGFNIVLKQRNEYLKTAKNNKINDIYISILNEKFVDLSYKIYKYRIDFINDINKNIGIIYEKIAGYNGLYIKYITNVDISDMGNFKTMMLDKLKDNIDKEIQYGISLYGPHRDDFSFMVDDNDLLLYGSQGQQKMAILSLKLSEIDVFKERSMEYPVLLLDDLFSELDLEKRNMIIEYLNNDIQVIITTTDLKNIDNKIIEKAKIYEIENGKIKI